MKKLIIIPCYNEQDSIENTIKDIKENAPDYDYVIINDCSKDNTLKICKENNFNVISLPVNLGIGGAVQTGYIYADQNDYDIAVQIDADGQHDPGFLSKMDKYLIENDCDMVIGSRFIENEGFQSSLARRIGINFFKYLLKVLFGKTITDATSGLRMCNKKTIAMFANEYPVDYPEPESTARLLRHKRSIKEIPVVMRERSGGVSSISLNKSIYYMIKVSLAILIEKVR